MNLSSMSWKDAEEYLKSDDRCVLPIGCTEQHAYLSLLTDSILAEKISLDAAEPQGVPVLPVMNYGTTPLFMDYPGTVSLRIDTLWNVVKDILESVVHHGFKRILIVNGHGGNMPIADYVEKWNKDHPEVKVKFHNWWNAPDTMAKVKEIDPIASHASWMENFEWTRLNNPDQPETQKPLIDFSIFKNSTPEKVRQELGDGSFGGFYQRSDEEMDKVWETAVRETRALLNENW
jgi:creatinine amidohydrolase